MFSEYFIGYNMRGLPNEILMRILAYLPTRDLLLNVARVSKIFYELTLCSNQSVTLCETFDQDKGKISNQFQQSGNCFI